MRVERGGNTLASAIACILSVGWLCLPAIQYLGSYQRVEVQTSGSVAFSALATLDLTPYYVVLLVVTLLFGVLGVLADRRSLISK
ncbi:MAG TPA: hypothetical protein VNJ09_00970 [Chthonomonadales bacterium]|nr:hypothetical protein [Chthonomonadales bacterium]